MPVAAGFDYAAIAPQVVNALTEAFPGAAIETEEGWRGRVHVKIISPAFNGMSEAAKQEVVWEALRVALEADAMAVSLVLPYGMDELP
jgi:stress-induced morphogen